MLPWIYYHESRAKLSLRICEEYSLQFIVSGLDRGWIETKQNHAFAPTLHENQATKVLVAGDKDAVLLLCKREQFRIASPGFAHFGRSKDVVAGVSEDPNCDGIRILIDEKSHATGET